MASDLLSYFYSSYKKAQKYNSNLSSRFQGSDAISNKSQVISSDSQETISELAVAGRGIFKAVIGVGILLNLKKIARFFVNFAGKYTHIKYKNAKGVITTLKDYLLSKNPGKLSEYFGEDIKFDGTLEGRADALEQKFQDLVSTVDGFIKNIGTGQNLKKDDQQDELFDKYSHSDFGMSKLAASQEESNFLKNAVIWSNSDARDYPAAKLFFYAGHICCCCWKYAQYG